MLPQWTAGCSPLLAHSIILSTITWYMKCTGGRLCSMMLLWPISLFGMRVWAVWWCVTADHAFAPSVVDSSGTHFTHYRPEKYLLKQSWRRLYLISRLSLKNIQLAWSRAGECKSCDVKLCCYTCPIIEKCSNVCHPPPCHLDFCLDWVFSHVCEFWAARISLGTDVLGLYHEMVLCWIVQLRFGCVDKSSLAIAGASTPTPRILFFVCLRTIQLLMMKD